MPVNGSLVSGIIGIGILSLLRTSNKFKVAVPISISYPNFLQIICISMVLARQKSNLNVSFHSGFFDFIGFVKPKHVRTAQSPTIQHKHLVWNL